MVKDKVARNAYIRARYAANREREKARALERYHARKHKIDRVAQAAYAKKWRADNPEKARGTPEKRAAKYRRDAIRYKTDPIYRAKICAKNRKTTPRRRLTTKNMNLMKKYGITPEQHLEMFNLQGRKCAICGAGEQLTSKQFPHVDHCHKTGKVRGLLCQKCNHGIGLFNDNPELLRAAASYLERA